jgi:chemotaxis protein MotB
MGAVGTNLSGASSAGSYWPSNWELSAARAASVVRLFVNRGVEPMRLTVVGLGEFHPIQSNATASGRNANRRVLLVILGNQGAPSGSDGPQVDHQSGSDSETKKPALPDLSVLR